MHTQVIAERVAGTNRSIAEIVSGMNADEDRKHWATRFGVEQTGPSMKNPEQIYAMQQELLALAFEEITSLREEVEKLKTTKASAGASAGSKK